MTLSTEAIKTAVFDGNGSTVAFAFTFKCFAQADLVVTLTRGSASGTSGVEETEALTTNYTVYFHRLGFQCSQTTQFH